MLIKGSLHKQSSEEFPVIMTSFGSRQCFASSFTRPRWGDFATKICARSSSCMYLLMTFSLARFVCHTTLPERKSLELKKTAVLNPHSNRKFFYTCIRPRMKTSQNTKKGTGSFIHRTYLLWYIYIHINIHVNICDKTTVVLVSIANIYIYIYLSQQGRPS